MGSGPGTLLSRKQVVQVQIQNHWLRTQFCFMSPMKSRSNSPAMNEDSVKRDQRSSSVPDEYNSEIKRTVVSRSRSITRSRSRSRSRRSLSRDRRDRSRSRSREVKIQVQVKVQIKIKGWIKGKEVQVKKQISKKE